MSPAAGVYDIEVYTNYAYHVELIGESGWLDVAPGDVVKNAAVVSIKYDANDGFARMVKLALVSESEEALRDTISFKQRAGQEPVLRFDDLSTVQLPGAGGETETPIVTNIPIEDLTVGIEYAEEGEEWLTGLDIEVGDSGNSTLKITSAQNTAATPRSATVRFSFVDGWGTSYSATLTALQANKDEGYFTSITFEEMRNTYATGEPIEDYVAVNGIVVSNKEQGNVGCPVQLNKTTIDYTPMNKTIYFESEDGQYGIVIYADSEEDNIFDQFDRVTLTLNGATLTKKGSGDPCPVRYELTGFDSSMVFSRTAGTEAPEKHRTIGALTDDDMFTYVSLDNAQIPVRKGALFAVHGTYYEASGNQKCTKYPLLVIDKEGNDLYMLTNSKCLYHRDGTRLPYGSGTLHGVVTHEHFSRFEWASGYLATDASGNYIYNDSTIEDASEKVGNIGKYQLRHQTKDDVWGDMNDDFKDGDFKLLTEYRYRVKKRATGDNAATDRNLPTDMGDSLDVPSYGKNGWLTHTYQTKYSGSSSKNETSGGVHLAYTFATYDYLGPIGRSSSYMYGINYGNKNGCGIIIDEDNEDTSWRPGRFAINRDDIMEYSCEYAKAAAAGYGDGGWKDSYKETYQSSFSSVPNGDGSGNAGVGRLAAGNNCGYGQEHWWDYSDTTDVYRGKPFGYLWNVSTADISSASVVCMQIAIRAVAEVGDTPRYWAAEWTDVDPEYGADVTWHTIGEFTVQDQGYSSNTSIWSCNAAKGINFKLDDASILGKENVYIYIHPTNDKCGHREKDYDTDYLYNTTECSIYLTYLAIRYIM